MLKVLGDRVLVLLEATPPDVVTDSGIVLMRDPDYRKVPTRGIVAQIGEKTGMCEIGEVRSRLRAMFLGHQGNMTSAGDVGDVAPMFSEEADRLLSEMAPAPFDVAVGNCVIFAPGDGEEVEFEGSTYVILREFEILGVVEAMAT